MIKLQKPEFVSWNGKLVKWDDAVLHIGSEAVTRGLNVFEGIKGYWHGQNKFGIVFLRRHYDRLLRSAKLLHIPCQWTYKEFESAIFDLMGTLLKLEKDMWIRTTLYVTEGHWGENTVADLVLTAFQQNKDEPEPINLGISTWQRSMDSMLPARIKTSTNYQVARLARIEGRFRNFQDMVVLNHWGRVAEATAACILMVRDGVIYTPPATEGALESITIDFVEALAESLYIIFIRRPIDRTELLIADELAICGTLAELVPVQLIDGNPIEPYGSLLTKIREKFFDVVRGKDTDPFFEVSFVPDSKLKI